MSIDIFKGGRRFVYAVMAIYAGTVLMGEFKFSPGAYLAFNVTRPDRAPEYTTTQATCADDDAIGNPAQYSNLWIALCFKPVRQGDRKRILYEFEGDTWKGGDRSSREVAAYVAEYEKTFVLPDSAKPIAERMLLEARIEHFIFALLKIAGGVAVIWGVGFGLGWIVRGFVGNKKGA